MPFTHLHVHTEYSMLDGVNRIPKLFERTKELGMDAVAMTDHGMMMGLAEFWKVSKDFSVKPIIGCEIYVAPSARGLREAVNGIKYYHLLLLAKNLTGYRNLLKIVSLGHLEGMYYKPRVDRELLSKYSEGLICTSACMAGPLSRHILRGEYDKAEDWLHFLKNTYKDDFYLELQRHGFNGSDELTDKELSRLDIDIKEVLGEESIDVVGDQKLINQKLREYSAKYKIPLVATTDAHYLLKEDKEVQTILFAVKDGKQILDDSCRKGYTDTYIASPEEMDIKFADCKEAIENTMVIADKIENYSIAHDRVQPKYWNLPNERTSEQELMIQTFVGAISKYSKTSLRNGKVEDLDLEFLESLKREVQESNFQKVFDFLGEDLSGKIQYELRIIHEKGYDDYFLVVSDLMKWAASVGILMGVRGSVAGSVAAHCLDIVEIEPIKWELYFERFLNPERPSPPDIDMDIQDSRRDEVIRYVEEKYGKESVAAVSAVGRFKTKAAIRDIARVMGIDLRIADKLSKMVHVLFGKVYSIDKMIKEDKEFANIIENDTQLQEMAGYVRKIENMSRHSSVHACGYLITPGPITDYVPVTLESKGNNRRVTQLEGPWLEELGLMKFDFLGLRTLTIVQKAIEIVNNKHGLDLNFYKLPLEDKKTFDLFSRGETIGVFQFESPPMQQYLKELRPENLEDICFLAAAYRPGPMQYIPDYIARKHGKQEIEYLTPEMEPIVKKTFGFAIYQEQVIRIAVDIAGYSMGAADLLRRAMGKKKIEVMQKEEIKFKEGIKAKGLSEAVGNGLWQYLLPFADYGFNKAHAAGYAVLAYKCAYLKAHYPIEFMTALMQSDLDNLDRVTLDMQEAKRMGYRVLPPNVNLSGIFFEPQGKESIRFGLGAIKNVSIKVCEKIVLSRNELGEFKHLDDLVYRVGTDIINKRSLESLIKSGSMESFGDRNNLLKVMPEVLARVSNKKKNQDKDQSDLFEMFADKNIVVSATKTEFQDAEPATETEKMKWEKELLGLFITTHPLQSFEWLKLFKEYETLNKVDTIRAGIDVKFAVTISSTKIVFTKKDNKKMAILTLEDLTGRSDAVMFPRVYEKFQHFILDTSPLIIRGIINEREERRSIIINEIEHAKTINPPTKMTIDITGVVDSVELASLKECFNAGTEVEVTVVYGAKNAPKKLIRHTSLTPQTINCLKKWVK